MHRLFVPPEYIHANRVVLTDQKARQLKQVLRFKPGDKLIVLDNTGREHVVSVVDIKSGQVVGEVVETHWNMNESGIKLVLYQALLKGDKFEMVLQKCTELGVYAFVPIICERCVAGTPGHSKLNRWQKIVTEAAEQAGRGKLPYLHDVINFGDACKQAEGKSLLLWEGEKITGIRSALKSVKGEDLPGLNIFVGPEGGFTDEEVEFARSRGVTPITLGKLTLRAETAGLVATSAVLYEYGELGAD